MNASTLQHAISSSVLLTLGLWDLFIIVRNFIMDGPITEMLKTGEVIFLVVLFSLILLIMFGKLYMGYMGLQYVQGKGYGKIHILAATIGIVLAAISFVIGFFDVISGATGIGTILRDVFNLVILIWYRKQAKLHLN